MSGSRQPNADPVIFLKKQGHFYCKRCTPDGVNDDKLMDLFKIMDHGTRAHLIGGMGDLGEFVSVCGFVHEWEIERRKAATRSLSDGRNERSHDKKDNDDDADGGPSNPAAPSYSAVLNQTMNTAGQPGSTVAAGGPSSYNTSSNIPFTTIRIPANFPYVTCDRCRARNRECHLDVYNQYCADCYCIGRKCFVNEVNTKEIWDDYTAQNPGAKALWVTPNYVTPIPNRQKRKAVAAGKKGVNNSAKESNDA